MGRSESFHCDFCKCAFKKSDPLYYFSYQKAEHDDRVGAEQYKRFLETLGKKPSSYSGIHNFEICEKCYNHIANAIAKRVEEIKKDWDSINNSFFKEEEETEEVEGGENNE